MSLCTASWHGSRRWHSKVDSLPGSVAAAVSNTTYDSTTSARPKIVKSSAYKDGTVGREIPFGAAASISTMTGWVSGRRGPPSII